MIPRAGIEPFPTRERSVSGRKRMMRRRAKAPKAKRNQKRDLPEVARELSWRRGE